MFGFIDNGIEEVETPEHVADQLLAAAKYMPAEQIGGPNCGVVLPTLDIARAKLWAMVEGAQLARSVLSKTRLFSLRIYVFPRPAVRGADR